MYLLLVLQQMWWKTYCVLYVVSFLQPLQQFNALASPWIITNNEYCGMDKKVLLFQDTI